MKNDQEQMMEDSFDITRNLRGMSLRERFYNTIPVLSTFVAIFFVAFRNVFGTNLFFFDIGFSLSLLGANAGYLFCYLEAEFSFRGRQFIILSILFSLASFILYWYNNILYGNRVMSYGVFYTVLIFVLLIFSMVGFLLSYLRGGFSIETNELGGIDLSILKKYQTEAEEKFRVNSNKIKDLENRTKNLEENNQKPSSFDSTIQEEQRNRLIDQIKATLQREASIQFMEDVKRQFEENFKITTNFAIIEQQLLQTHGRLTRALEALSRRGSLNLILGILTTLSGLAILTYFVFTITEDLKDSVSLFAYYVPRLSLVIFIEIFAYFFLKLYKSSLSENKYFQNELTNIEAKYLSLRVAMLNSHQDTITKVIGRLAETERNFILEKDQTTVELERTKVENEAEFKILKILPEIIKPANKKES